MTVEERINELLIKQLERHSWSAEGERKRAETVAHYCAALASLEMLR